MTKNKKIMIMCSDGPHHKYLISQLQTKFNLAGIVIETENAQRRTLRRKPNKTDYFYRIYHGMRRDLTGLNSYRRKYFTTRDFKMKIVIINQINSRKYSIFTYLYSVDFLIYLLNNSK